ncbi:hypothetical protein HY636_05055 [Candidatus Woesearchaeota archaeon]|nr:hypothetical protein [Candidatus Woesearchaeota archaeon]
MVKLTSERKKESRETSITSDEAHKKKLLQLSEISLIIDTYDDIFSDFDPRPYSQRALSDDFLLEAKKASKDKVSGMFELNFLIPSHLKNKLHENIIKKRLKEHFKRHHASVYQEKQNILKTGVLFSVIGIVIMFITSILLFKYDTKTFLASFIIILLEPAGWFLFWEGMHQVIFETRTKRPDIEFYEKMSKCTVNFIHY